jgi:hypothetical protein
MKIMIKLSSIIKEICKDSRKLFMLLIESRVDDFKEKYKTLPDDVKNDIIKNDPSSNRKYLDWMGRIVYSNPDIKLDDLFKYIKEFYKYQVALGDIYKYKTYNDLQQALATRQKSNKERKRGGAEILIDNSDFLVVAPTTQDSCAYYGNNTRWCIVSSENWWNQYYYKNTIIILLDRRNGEKYAIVGDRDNGDYTVYDRNDNTLNYGRMFGDEEESWPEYVQEAIEDYMSSDDIDRRKEKYYQTLIDKFVEDEGTDSIWERYVKHLNREYKIEDTNNSLESFKSVAGEYGLDEEKLKELAISFLWNQIFDGTVEDDLGYIYNSEELRRSLDEGGNEPHIKDTLEQIDVDYVRGARNIDGVLEILQQAIPPQEYYRLYNNGTIDEDIFDAIVKYNRMLNSKQQQTFATTKEGVQIKNINDIIFVLKRTGYENVAGYLETLTDIKESVKPMTIKL